MDNWPKEHHIPFTEKALANKSLLKLMPFCASPKTQSHFKAQDDIFQFKSIFSPILFFTNQYVPTEPTFLGELENAQWEILKIPILSLVSKKEATATQKENKSSG